MPSATYSDVFTGTNGTAWSANWQAQSTSGTMTTGSGHNTIQSNTGQAHVGWTSLGVWLRQYTTSNYGSTDITVGCHIATASMTSNPFIFVRATNATAASLTCYAARLRSVSDGKGTNHYLDLYRVVSGVWTTLTSVGISNSLSCGITLRAVNLRNGNVHLRVSAVSVVSADMNFIDFNLSHAANGCVNATDLSVGYTDSSGSKITSSGKVGVGLVGVTTGTNTIFNFDQFKVEENYLTDIGPALFGGRNYVQASGTQAAFPQTLLPLESGDLGLYSVYVKSHTATITAPSGWTTQYISTNTGGGGTLAVFSKIFDGSETGTITPTWTSNPFAVSLVVYKNVCSVDPIRTVTGVADNDVDTTQSGSTNVIYHNNTGRYRVWGYNSLSSTVPAGQRGGIDNTTSNLGLTALHNVSATAPSQSMTTSGSAYGVHVDLTILSSDIKGGVSTVAMASARAGDPRFETETTVTETYTGAEEQFVVPAGVTSIDVDLYGAKGGQGQGSGGPGGNGGRITTTLAVTPGETLYLRVGGTGANNSGTTGGSGGFYGGATGGNAGSTAIAGGGGGGGASDIRQGGTTDADRVVVAGGGGGGQNNNTAGGGGGHTLDTEATTPNAAVNGVTGGFLVNGGGGGGAGWRGGGGGAVGSAASGGGSNMHDTTVCSNTTSYNAVSTGAGSITITYVNVVNSSVSAPVMTATASAPAPVINTGATIVATPMTGSALAHNANILLGVVEINAPPMTATALAPNVVIGTSVTITSDLMTASASAPNPLVVFGTGSLLPTGPGTGTRNWALQTYSDIDEPYESPNDTDAIMAMYPAGGTANGSTTSFEFTDMPSDFGQMYSLMPRYRVRFVNWVDDNITIYCGIYKSTGERIAGGSASTDYILANSLFTGADYVGYNGFYFSWIDQTASKTDWDNAQIRFTQTYSAVGLNDSDGLCATQISQFELVGQYQKSGSTNITVNATVATASALAHDATVTADAEVSVTSDLMTASALMPDALVSGDAFIQSELATANAAALDATVTAELNIQIVADVMLASALAHDAVVTTDTNVTVTSDLMLANAAALDATVSADISIEITAELMTANALALDASIITESNIEIASEVMMASALAHDATITTDVEVVVDATTMPASALFHDVLVSGDAVVNADIASASAMAYPAEVTNDANVNVAAETALANADAVDPIIITDSIISVTVATASALAHDAIVGTGTGIDADTMVASGSALAPSISTDVNIVCTVATASALARDAGVSGDALVGATVGLASAMAHAPVVSTDFGILIEASTMTATASMLEANFASSIRVFVSTSIRSRHIAVSTLNRFKELHTEHIGIEIQDEDLSLEL